MSKLWLTTLPRWILGAIFLVGAIDGFAFIATGAHLVQPPTAPRGLAFEEALKAAGFLWPFMKTVELVGALCLLTNRAPAFGLALLSPIIAVVVLFHGFLNPQGMPLAAVLVICAALLLRFYAARFKYLFDHGEPRLREQAPERTPKLLDQKTRCHGSPFTAPYGVARLAVCAAANTCARPATGLSKSLGPRRLCVEAPQAPRNSLVAAAGLDVTRAEPRLSALLRLLRR